jgi:hypothetical protein
VTIVIVDVVIASEAIQLRNFATGLRRRSRFSQ